MKGKGHPTARLWRHRENLEVDLQSIHNLGARSRWVVDTTLRPLYPGKDPVLIVQKDAWTSGPVWSGTENLTHTAIRSLDRPASSKPRTDYAIQAAI